MKLKIVGNEQLKFESKFFIEKNRRRKNNENCL